MEETARCRHCARPLRGKPYYMGGPAFHPISKEQCKVNYYGGFVCSESCDLRASLELESSMPGAGSTKRLSSSASSHHKNNWR